MTEFFADFHEFYRNMGFTKFLRLFWYFAIFDFVRYVVGDYIVFALSVLQRKKKEAQYSSARADLFSDRPLVSVIAPGKNEGKHIPSLARSLKLQTYKNYELVIADDGSDDDTPAVCRQLLQERLISRYFRNDVRGGKASAANLALRYSRGKFIVHVDADTYLDRNAIENIIIPFYLDEKIGAVAGDVRVANSEGSLAASLQAIEYLKGISIGRWVSSTFGILRIVPGAFGAFRKDIIDKLKGWDVGPGLDGDLTVKIRKLHYRIFFEHTAFCHTSVPDTFAKLARQRYRWDRSLVRFRLRKHRDVFMPSENFRFNDFFSFLENFLFNFILNLKWWVYLIDILLNYSSLIKFIVPMNYILYYLSNIIQYVIGVILLGRTITKKELKLFIFLPLMPLYTTLYMRIVRTYAYLSELIFKVSYKDRWNPAKVSRKALEKGL